MTYLYIGGMRGGREGWRRGRMDRRKYGSGGRQRGPGEVRGEKGERSREKKKEKQEEGRSVGGRMRDGGRQEGRRVEGRRDGMTV
jgi:hypothetical protein